MRERNPQSWPATGRLASYKAKAEKSAKNNPSSYGADWRYWVKPVIPDKGISRHEGKIYSYQPGALSDYLGDVPDVMKRVGAYRWHEYPCGYYTTRDCHETVSGGVERLKTSRGAYYIPVTFYSDSDMTTYYMAQAIVVPKGAGDDAHTDAMREAAKIADGEAASIAEREREREHDEAYMAG